MRVILRKDVLGEATHWKHLDNIILQIDRGAHEWEVEEPEIIEKSGWYQESRDYIRLLFEHSTKRGVYPRSVGDLHVKRVAVTSHSVMGQELGLSPEPAAAYLQKPLTILVENRFSDALFGTIVMDFLGSSELTEFRKNLPDALKFDGGGGNGELPKVLAKYIQEAQTSGHPVRVVAFTDSDARVPGDISDNAQRAKRACIDQNVPCVLLKKRAIENYIPDEIFYTSTSKHKQVAALMDLTPLQRDHFPLKKGFPNDLAQLTQEETVFYASVPASDKETLKNAFGTEVIGLLETFKKNLSIVGLQRRDSQGELKQIVNMIMGEI